MYSDAAERIQLSARCSGRNRGLAGSHLTGAPYAGVVTPQSYVSAAEPLITQIGRFGRC